MIHKNIRNESCKEFVEIDHNKACHFKITEALAMPQFMYSEWH